MSHWIIGPQPVMLPWGCVHGSWHMAEAWRCVLEVLDRLTQMFSPGRSASERYLSAAAQAWPRGERGTDGISPACIISQCVGQKSGSAGLSAQCLSRPKSRCWTSLLLRDTLGNYPLVTCLNCWQSSPPFSCRSKVTIFLLAVGRGPSFSHVTSHLLARMSRQALPSPPIS